MKKGDIPLNSIVGRLGHHFPFGLDPGQQRQEQQEYHHQDDPQGNGPPHENGQVGTRAAWFSGPESWGRC